MNNLAPNMRTGALVERAWREGIAVPAFNIPYLPMMAAVVDALRETKAFGLITVARLEWTKFESGSVRAVCDEYECVKDERYTRLHLDHVPVIDEDDLRVDYLDIMRDAIGCGYDSVMIDGSRLPLEENIACTRAVVELAHAEGIAVEAELGAVMGHESGPLPPYEELFASGKGFTEPEQARRFVEQTEVDWLSVAIGNIHGAISAARKSERKVQARLDIDRLRALRDATRVPLVLHGGTGIAREYIHESIRNGIGRASCRERV
jgi:ketose-bisphosphate aldolase